MGISEVAKAGLETAASVSNAISTSKQINRTLGISQREYKRLLREVQANDEIVKSFVKYCQDYPDLEIEGQVGGLKLRNRMPPRTRTASAESASSAAEELGQKWLLAFLAATDERLGALQTEKIDRKAFLSLTEIAKMGSEISPDDVIKAWFRTRQAIEFMALWEEHHNPEVKTEEIERLKAASGQSAFTLSPKEWADRTNAVGVVLGERGETLAHPDIAFKFAGWLSTGFELYLIAEFRRLMTQQQQVREPLEMPVPEPDDENLQEPADAEIAITAEV